MNSSNYLKFLQDKFVELNSTIIQKTDENEFKNTIDDAIEIDFDYNAMVDFQVLKYFPKDKS
jgi:hypothetical protein